MAASQSVSVSRKPSNSSTRSNTHSPSGSPANPQPPRRLTPNQAGAMLGVGMASTRQLKPLSPGWSAQMWPDATKRNVSSSTATSGADRASSHADSGYRSMSEGGWRHSGAWEDAGNSSVLNDPVQYDTLAAPGTLSRQAASVSPSGALALPRAPSGVVDNDLARSFRGMATEDAYSQGNFGFSQPMHGSGRSPVQRSPRHGSQQLQGAYPPAGFPQIDYAPYPSALPSQDPYNDHSFPYDAYRTAADPAVYAASSLPGTGAVFPSPNAFYDFPAPAVHPARFYFTPPMQHSPMAPAIMYPSPLTTSQSAHQRMARPGEYSPQLPMMVAGGTVYPSLNPAPIFPQVGVPHDSRGMPLPYGQGQQSRSPLLEEFRANKARRWELRDILGHAVEFSVDQHGSRFMQHRYDTATPEVKQGIFEEIVPTYVKQLVQDVFGNYVVQKLFEHGTTAHRSQLVAAMEGHIFSATLQMYGCRVVQKAIDCITPEQQSIFVKELEPHIMKCVKDANGNHVVQKLIEKVPVERLTFIKLFQGSVYELASHPYGCRVLQRCLEHLGTDATRPLLDELQKYASELMQDQFGNYVVQFLLENGKAQDRAAVILRLHGQMLPMSRHKFASNVVEKALITADPEVRRVLIDELMAPKHDGTNSILVMMKDQFANYVLQRAMTVAEGQQQQELAKLVRPQLAQMRRVSSVYTKHLNSIERCLNKVQKAIDA